MDIQGTQSGPERARQSFEEQKRALIDSNRALVRAALDKLSRQRPADAQSTREEQAASGADSRPDVQRDEIRLTAAAASAPSPSEREARVRALAEAHRMEQLHTPERIERAAQRLLEG